MARRDRAEDHFTVQAPRRPLFAPLPEALVFDREVEDRAARLWAVLDRIAAGRAAAINSRAGLAEVLDCSTSSVDRARRNLEDTGWMDVERVAGEASRYTLHDRKSPISTTLVTRDDTPNGRSHRRTDPLVTGDQTPSSRVTTEGREELGEVRETPNPAPRGAHECEQHSRPVRGCCARRDRQAREAARAEQLDRERTAELLRGLGAGVPATAPPPEWEATRAKLAGRRPA